MPVTALHTELLPSDRGGIERAALLLRAGGLVAFGTETVYGLGAEATQPRAVAAIFAAKGRPHFNPLICHYPSADAAFADVEPNDQARALAAAFWPGPLTLVLPRRADSQVASLAGAGLETLAVRVPSHPTALALLRATGRPVAAPSANRSGQVSPTCAGHVLAGLEGRIDAVLDSGPCAVGVESTVIDLTGSHPILLRPGGVTAEEIREVIGTLRAGITLAKARAHETLRSPGLMVSHYAPTLPVRLAAETVDANEALLAFGPPLAGAAIVYQLSVDSDLEEAASRLFDGLRTLDRVGVATGVARIATMSVPESGLGVAINDRLTRAAAPRQS